MKGFTSKGFKNLKGTINVSRHKSFSLFEKGAHIKNDT